MISAIRLEREKEILGHTLTGWSFGMPWGYRFPNSWTARSTVCLASAGRRSRGTAILILLRPDIKGNGTGTCIGLEIAKWIYIVQPIQIEDCQLYHGNYIYHLNSNNKLTLIKLCFPWASTHHMHFTLFTGTRRAWLWTRTIFT